MVTAPKHRPGRLALRAGGLVVALVADRALGEPPALWHPVARFGRLMELLEGRLWADRRGRGVLFTAAGVAVAAASGRLLAGRRAGARFATVAFATYVALAGRALGEAAQHVAAALDADDLPEARQRLRSLVGRETAELDRSEVIRATVESVAENTVDAAVAPLLWAAAGGPVGVLTYRAINTLDAMVGHRSLRYERFGWAAARADDVANWIPARVTAAVVALLRPRQARAVLAAVRNQAPAHPSPNAGVAEASFAAALGVRLGGPSDYAGRIEERPLLGAGAGPSRVHIDEACRLSRQANVTVVGVVAAIAAAAAASAGSPDSPEPPR